MGVTGFSEDFVEAQSSEADDRAGCSETDHRLTFSEGVKKSQYFQAIDKSNVLENKCSSTYRTQKP